MRTAGGGPLSDVAVNLCAGAGMQIAIAAGAGQIGAPLQQPVRQASRQSWLCPAGAE